VEGARLCGADGRDRLLHLGCARAQPAFLAELDEVLVSVLQVPRRPDQFRTALRRQFDQRASQVGQAAVHPPRISVGGLKAVGSMTQAVALPQCEQFEGRVYIRELPPEPLRDGRDDLARRYTLHLSFDLLKSEGTDLDAQGRQLREREAELELRRVIECAPFPLVWCRRRAVPVLRERTRRMLELDLRHYAEVRRLPGVERALVWHAQPAARQDRESRPPARAR